jgi:hypothetical protein
MASYRGHLTFSTGLGLAYGGLALWQWDMDWGVALIAGGVTALGGMLPDLDSDSGVPVREMFGLSAALVPFLLYQRVLSLCDFSPERALAVLAGLYLFIRYGLSSVFKRLTVHRGMFHSLPAMLIAGLAVYLLYHSEDVRLRLLLAGGVMIGFLSHLVLDELCSVDFSGVRLHLNQFAGSAVKLRSPSWPATLATYAVLAALAYAAHVDWERNHYAPGDLVPRSPGARLSERGPLAR